MKYSSYTSFFYILFLAVFTIACNRKELPSLSINKNTPIGWTDKEACKIIYKNNNDSTILRGKIKCRGGSSSRYFKHSFALELNNKFSFSGLTMDDDWILNANYIDKTFMRHKISFDLFKEMNANNIASNCAYVNLNINNSYEGLYVIMEEINGAMIGLNKNDPKAVLFKEPPLFSKEKVVFVQDTMNYYQQKYPKISKSDKTAELDTLKNFLFYSTDKEFAKNITNWVDINNVIDWHLILLFSNNSDGMMKNFFLYKIDKNTPFRFAIWDYDHSFGRDGDNEKNLMVNNVNWRKVILLDRLSKIPELNYMFKLKQRWFELRKNNTFSLVNFKKHINNNDKIIRYEVEKNFKRWPADNKSYFDANNYQQELDLMLEFVEMRIENLDNYFNNIQSIN